VTIVSSIHPLQAVCPQRSTVSTSWHMQMVHLFLFLSVSISSLSCTALRSVSDSYQRGFKVGVQGLGFRV
jgi:hypothetical protein